MYSDYFQNMNMDNTITGNNNTVNQDMDVSVNMNSYNPSMPTGGCSDGVQERIVNRTFVHEVPQDCFFMIEK